MEHNDGFELSRRKALAALGGIGAASAGAGLGTTAYFSDEESFENNTLTAGELDLKIDWQQTYNGPIPGTGGEVGEHPVNAYPDTAVDGQSYGDGLQDLDGVRYSGAGDVDPVFDAADVPACCDCGEDEYYVTYEGESYCISAISGNESTEEFYDYDTGEWSSLNDDIQRRNTAVLFLYEDDEGDLHLFIINNKLDNTRSSENGFVASVTVEGAEGSQWLNADWVEQDEPGTDIDTYQDANGNNVATADWAWQNRKTDGGVLGTLDEDFALQVIPALNDAATYDGNTVFQDQTDIERLVLLDGDTSTEVVLEGDIGSDGDLDPFVIHSSCGIDSGAELDTPAVFRSENYPDQERLVELDDVKPGDRGEITFSIHLCDNLGYIWFTAGNFSQEGGTLTEPERVAMNESDPGSVTESDDAGDLADYVDVTLWYDEDCDNVYDEETETEIFEGNLADLMDELGVVEGADEEDDGFSGMLQLDADPGTEDVECFPGQEGFCIGFEWEVSTEVGNVIQGDSVGFDLGFYTEQCRHNDGSGPDGNGTNQTSV